MNYDLLHKIKNILLSTNNNNFKVNNLNLDGFSGNKLLFTLHSLTSLICQSDIVYLEIGVFKGLTLLSNSFSNKNTKCYGIDNFSLFDDNLQNMSFVLNKKNELFLNNCFIINSDYEKALLNLNSYIPNTNIGVFFIDGAHDYRTQLVSLLHIKPYLNDDSIIIIDDANYPHVRQATNDFLRSHTEFALLFEAYTKSHPFNMSNNDFINLAKDGWWNGINIIIKDPSNHFIRSFTQESNKELYFISHDIFRNKYSNISYEIIKLAQNSNFDQLKKLMNEHYSSFKLYDHQNTYSEFLTDFNIL